MSEDVDELVLVEGIVHLHTDLGVFLDLQGRRVFIPEHCMAPADQHFESGHAASLHVLRSFATQEGLI